MLRQQYPDGDAEDYGEPHAANPAAVDRLVIDGADYESYQAERLWQRIQALPADEQEQRIRSHLFRSTVFFDLLRRKSREEGRQDRERGVRIAELALVSLEGHDGVFRDRIHDLRALGWASLANARRLALDAEGAASDLDKTEEEWSIPRAEKDLAVLAEIRLLEAGMRTYQDRYGEALELLGESLRLARLTGKLKAQAQALILRATVRAHLKEPNAAIKDLRSSLALDHQDPYLILGANLNLVALLARFDRLEEAARSIGKLRKLSMGFGRLAQSQVDWLEANVKHRLGERKQAEVLYLEASSGFLVLGEMTSFALTTLDISVLYLEEKRPLRAAALIRQALPILQSLNLGPESLMVIESLAEGVEADKTTVLLLQRIQQILSHDPAVPFGGWFGHSAFLAPDSF